MMGGMMGNGWGGMFVGAWILGILFLALMVLAALALIRYISRPTRHDSGGSAFDILKTRYARGEINKQEFEEKKKDLGA